ncbi:uncharacterized protein LOC108151496 [Drosophila miranda]|uniref:uncharacterized protein LOC108151496 n=1 Tax=Drosophila miranda TaxID=7229 RepID=UPI0007E5BDD9|nr:uncharacterized protein LOC108151496 [Drosophila miranda]XP_017135637.1 uncharacterized protein LOC108151496 [Drosophila miranda]
MSSADTNPVAIPQENPSPPPSPCPKKKAKLDNKEIEQKGDNDQHEFIQAIQNNGPGPGKTATLQAQIESSGVAEPMDIDSEDETIQGKPDKETQGFETPISTDIKNVGTPQKIDAALWKKRLLQKMYLKAKAKKRKANTGQAYYCQTASKVLSYKDLTAKLREEAKRTGITSWLPFKLASKQVISTLIKSRQTPNLGLSDVHNVIAGTAKHLKYKTLLYITYENYNDNPWALY